MDQLKKNADQVNIGGEVGIHSYSVEERQVFSDHINFYLKDDPHVADLLPINPDSEEDLFAKVGDGIILCKLINLAAPNTIDPRAIVTKRPLNIFNENINLNLAIQSAKSINCVVVSIRPDLIKDRRPHIILGLIWQIIRIQLTRRVDLKQNPFLMRLKREDEELSDLLKLPPDQLLLRWFNYHLKNAKYERQIHNFDKDLKDGEPYVILLNQLDKNQCDLSGLEQQGDERAKNIISNSEKLGVPKFMRPQFITKGDPKLNLIFCAQIFNACPGLTPTEDDFKAAQMLDEDDDIESSMDERVFKMWINSLNLPKNPKQPEEGETVYIQNLIQDLKDGVILPILLDRLKPGSVNWKIFSLTPKMAIHKRENANNALHVISDQFPNVKLVNVRADDINNGKKKLVLGVIWQLFRMDAVKTVGDLTDQQLLDWGNSRIPEADRVAGFKDVKIKTGVFFFKLMGTIEPRSIDWENVKPGDTQEEIDNNAKYVVSVARRLGVTVFLIWEQIANPKPKMLAVFVASLIQFSKEYKIGKE